MTQIQITLPENVLDAIRAEATQSGVTTNILARIRLCQIYSSQPPDASFKSYLIGMKNCREIEAYGETMSDFWLGWSSAMTGIVIAIIIMSFL